MPVLSRQAEGGHQVVVGPDFESPIAVVGVWVDPDLVVLDGGAVPTYPGSQVAPADRAGYLGASAAALTDDTKSYAYSFMTMTSHLFVAEDGR